ncbi:hypothetical protein BPT24_005 [Tenacibaculum phage pT24]|uniref:Uncharacterized protein n=1 Tax=Tenacibaculum phage pT24 TaxID=1880590 RepID=A0A1W7GKP8_9CAUD|nr:hypothetical protein HYP10_gp005 [Tenacibaculum phage pT24]BAX25546.1 hypothetical protein BPT24_005 [Tenacibaculum phage pT24]
MMVASFNSILYALDSNTTNLNLIIFGTIGFILSLFNGSLIVGRKLTERIKMYKIGSLLFGVASVISIAFVYLINTTFLITLTLFIIHQVYTYKAFLVRIPDYFRDFVDGDSYLNDVNASEVLSQLSEMIYPNNCNVNIIVEDMTDYEKDSLKQFIQKVCEDSFSEVFYEIIFNDDESYTLTLDFESEIQFREYISKFKTIINTYDAQ